MRQINSPIILLLVTYLILALAYSVVIPPFEGLDEIEHFGVIRYVAEMTHLPVQHDPVVETYHARQEASQPPLYYLIAGPLLRTSGIATANTYQYLIPNPYVTCGTENVRSNKVVLRHDLYAEGFPWHDALLALHLLRALSVLLQAFTVAGVYAIARRVRPDRPGVAFLAASLTAFNPQFLIVTSGINNDNIATPVITWTVYLCVVVAQEGLILNRAVALGVLIGLSSLSKLTGLLLLPLAALAVVLNLKSQILNPKLRSTQSAMLNLVIMTSITVMVAGWWYVRNLQLYGDPTGLYPMLDIVGWRGPVPLNLWLSELGLVFRSYWGQFSCAFFDSQFYYATWAAVTALSLAGLILSLLWDQAPYTSRVTLYILLAWFAVVFIGWARWNLTTPAPGGRLLFSAVGATSTLLAFGLTSLPSPFFLPTTRRARRSLVLGYIGSLVMAAVGLFTLLLWVRPIFASPPIMNQANASPQHRLDARFGESIAMLGYDLHADNLGPGRYIDVTLYWRAVQRMHTDYTLALQLTALAPGDTRTLLNFNTWTGGGTLPTAAWQVGPVMVDRYHVPLPLDTGATQAWRLQVLFYAAQSGNRLPLTLNNQPAGEALTLGIVRVAGTTVVSMPADSRLTTPVTFDHAIALTHTQVETQVNGVRVRLLWQAQAPLPRDATVFVHAYDAAGKQISTGDGPPMSGNFPTSQWQTGDQVLDEHELTLPVGLALSDVQIQVGLYQPEDGRRLEAWQGTLRLPDDAVSIR